MENQVAGVSWEIYSGSVDPHRKKAMIMLRAGKVGAMVQITGIQAEDYPAGEPAQQKRLREDAAAMLREAAAYLESQ